MKLLLTAISIAILSAGCSSTYPKGKESVSTESVSPKENRANKVNKISLKLLGNSNPTVKSITMAEVLDLANSNNLEMAIARVGNNLYSQKFNNERSRFLPKLRISAGNSQTDGMVQGSFGELRDVDKDKYDSRISLVYRINIGKQVHDSIAAHMQYDQSRFQSKDSEQRLLRMLVDLYQNLLFARASTEIADAMVDDSKQFLDIIRAREKQGVGLGSDVARAEAKLSFDKKDALYSRNEWALASISLAHILRLDTKEMLSPAETVLRPLEMLPDDVDINLLVLNRADLNAAQMEYDRAKAKTKAAQWDLLAPELIGEASESMIGDDLGDLEDQRYYAFYLSWEISIDRIGKIKERRAEAEIARLQLAQTTDAAASELTAAQKSLATFEKIILLSRQALNAADKNMKIQMARYTAGTSMILEVLDAQNTQAQARIDLAESIVSYNRAQAALLTAAGIISRELIIPKFP